MPVVLPDGRFLRDVLRRRRDRVARARHHADQARQASRQRHSDVRRADRALRRISAPADRARPPCRGLRTARGSRRSAQARRQERGTARRGPAGHVRHADRGFAARRQAQQLPAGAGAEPRFVRRGSLRAGLDRHIDRRILRRRMRPRDARGRDRPHRAGRDHRLRRVLCRHRTGALFAFTAGAHAAAARRVRRRHRGAAAGRLLRRRHHGVVRRVFPRRADRRGRRRHLCRAHPARQASAAVAAGARGRRRHARDRSGDPRQSRTGAHAVRRTPRFAARPRSTGRQRRPDRDCWRSGLRRR